MQLWVWQLIQVIWGTASPQLRESVEKSIREWEAKAKETKGKTDDILVGLAKWLLGIS